MPVLTITRRLVCAAVIAVLSLTSATAITAGTAGASGSGSPQQTAPLQQESRTTGTKPVNTPSRPSTTAPASSAATTSAPTSPPTGLCTPSTAVWFAGYQYCPGYVIGLTTNAYPAGSRVVLRAVQVVRVSGTNVTVMGGPSCLPNPDKPYCGASIPTVTVAFASSSGVPTYGQIINLYGIAGSRSMTPTGHEVIGFCDPDWGC